MATVTVTVWREEEPWEELPVEFERRRLRSTTKQEPVVVELEVVGAECDCGAEVAETTHARWCSTKAVE